MAQREFYAKNCKIRLNQNFSGEKNLISRVFNFAIFFFEKSYKMVVVTRCDSEHKIIMTIKNDVIFFSCLFVFVHRTPGATPGTSST